MDPDQSRTDRGPADFDRRHNSAARCSGRRRARATRQPWYPSPAATWTCQRDSWPFGPGTPSRSGSRGTTRARSPASRFTGRTCSARRRSGRHHSWRSRALFRSRPPSSCRPPALSAMSPATACRARGSAPRSIIAFSKGLRPQPAQRHDWISLDVFNLLNHVNSRRCRSGSCSPACDRTKRRSARAGRITSTTTGPREVQFSLGLHGDPAVRGSQGAVRTCRRESPSPLAGISSVCWRCRGLQRRPVLQRFRRRAARPRPVHLAPVTEARLDRDVVVAGDLAAEGSRPS